MKIRTVLGIKLLSHITGVLLILSLVLGVKLFFVKLKKEKLELEKLELKTEKYTTLQQYFQGRYNPFEKWYVSGDKRVLKKDEIEKYSPKKKETDSKKTDDEKTVPVPKEKTVVHITTIKEKISDWNIMAIVKDENQYWITAKINGSIEFLKKGDIFDDVRIDNIKNQEVIVSLLEKPEDKYTYSLRVKDDEEKPVQDTTKKTSIQKKIHLNIKVQNLTEHEKKKFKYPYNYGIIVTQPDTAHKQIIKNDIIMTMNNTVVKSIIDMFKALEEETSSLNIELWRNEQKMNINIKD